jgi:hypothetical protein
MSARPVVRTMVKILQLPFPDRFMKCFTARRHVLPPSSSMTGMTSLNRWVVPTGRLEESRPPLQSRATARRFRAYLSPQAIVVRRDELLLDTTTRLTVVTV